MKYAYSVCTGSPLQIPCGGPRQHCFACYARRLALAPIRPEPPTGATPTTHRSRVDRSGWWLGGYCVFLTQHTTPHNHTQPSICDGAHKLKDCARAQMQGCVFRSHFGSRNHIHAGMQNVMERAHHDSHFLFFFLVLLFLPSSGRRQGS